MLGEENKKYRLETFGKKVEEARKAAHYTQEKLAEKINVDVRTIKRIEAGEGNVTLIRLFELSEALKVHVKHLIT